MQLAQHETIIFGGSFNPPTLAHRDITEVLLQTYPDADVWLMPSGERHDKAGFLPSDQRLEMLEIVRQTLSEPERVAVCDLELKDTGVTETYRTVGRLATAEPTRSFRYVFGGDAYLGMPAWRHGEELQAELPMIVVPRDGGTIGVGTNCDILKINLDEGISSSEVRRRLNEGLPIDQLVCRGIQNYIAQRHPLLY